MSNWYTLLSAQTFAVVLQIPWIVTLIFAAAAVRRDAFGRWGKEFVLVLFGLYLSFWQLILYILQINFNMARQNPFQPQGPIYYGFPSEVGFYVAVFVTFIMEFTLVWNVVFSWMYWSGLIMCILVPSVVLTWFQFNTWQEVLLSMGCGFLATTIFILALYFYIKPELPIWLNTIPFTWFSCVDTWIQTREEQEETERVRQCYASIDRQLPRRRGLGRLLHSLY